MNIKSIAIFYGHVASNVGDIAINRGEVNLLQAAYPQAQITAVLLNVKNSRYMETSKASFGPEGAVRLVEISDSDVSGVDMALDPERWLVHCGVADADLVVLAAGEHLFSYEGNENPRNLFWRTLPAFAARQAGKACLVMPSTFGPYETKSARALMEALIAGGPRMAARETRSIDVLRELAPGREPQALLDPAFFIVPPPARAPEEGPRNIALVMRSGHWGMRIAEDARLNIKADDPEMAEQETAYRFSLDFSRKVLDETEHRVTMFVQTDADRAIAEAVERELSGSPQAARFLKRPVSTIDDYLDALNAADHVVASRFHALILGMVCGKPGYGLYFASHGHKIPGLMDLVGRPADCLDLSTMEVDQAVQAAFDAATGPLDFSQTAARLEALRAATKDWLRADWPERQRAELTPKDIAALTAIVGGFYEELAGKFSADAARKREQLDKLKAKQGSASSDAKIEIQRANASDRIRREEIKLLKSALHDMSEKFGESERLAEEQKAEIYRLSTEIGKLAFLRRRTTQLENSTSFRLGNALVRLARWPLSIFQGLRGPQNRRPLPTKARGISDQLSIFKDIPKTSARMANSVPNRVAYVLHNSLPYASGGYATRAQGLAKGLADIGFEVVGVTRPGFPLDAKPELSGSQIAGEDTIDGIRYCRVFTPSRSGSRAIDYMRASADALTETFQELQPAIVVAASNYQTAAPALIAARRLGIPFFYEVRGFWEITRISREPEFVSTSSYKIQERMEAETAKRANHVFTLTGPMKQELVRRGVPEGHITLLPNSCQPERFIPRPRDEKLAEKLDIPPQVPVIGYIGTFVQYEGLELLVKAALELRSRGLEFRLLLVGNENVSAGDSGPITNEIRRIASDGGLGDWLIMPGRIPHDQVEAYYSLIDIAPFPRKAQPVTEMVSPMKPLEAFAMEKAVVASSVGALLEMVQDGRTGLIFEKENVESLADVLAKLIADPELRKGLGAEARRWVESERTWKATARIAADRFGLSSSQSDSLGRPPETSVSGLPADTAGTECHRPKLPYKKRRARARARSRIALLRHAQLRDASKFARPELRDGAVLYLLHNCLPHHTGGYAIRAHGLLKGFQDAGRDVIAQARLGYPADRKRNETNELVYEMIDGVEYRFLPDHVSIDQIDQVGYVEHYAESVLNSADLKHVGYVHAASFFQNGLAGRMIADRLGVPLVYEMRGMEWLTNGSLDADWQGSMPGIVGREMELAAARSADHVFAITHALGDWLVENGIEAGKISVLPNGCVAEEAAFASGRDDALARELDLDGAFVIGYIGSVVFYEGIDLIVRAVGQVRKETGLDVRFLLVGDGPDSQRITQFIDESGARDFVRQTGRVPHSDVDRYYSLVDAFVMARTDLEICNIISPLKPLEALMKRKLLITSDVDAIREMVIASEGGAVTFKAGSVSELSDRIVEAAREPERMAEIAQKGHRWAVEQRSWSVLARKALETLEGRFGRGDP